MVVIGSINASYDTGNSALAGKIRLSIAALLIAAMAVSCRTQTLGIVLQEEIADISRANSIYVEFSGEQASSFDAELVSAWVSLFRDLNHGWIERPDWDWPNRPWDARFFFGRQLESKGLNHFWVYDNALVTKWGNKHFYKTLSETEFTRLKEQFRRTEQPGA